MNNDEKKLQFHEALSFLVESANINNGSVTIDEIKDTFKDIIDNDSMYQPIYDYLLENKITIKGYKVNIQKEGIDNTDDTFTTSTEAQDDKEHTFVKMYLDEVSNRFILSNEEQIKILNNIIHSSDDNECKLLREKLIESNLDIVVELANEFTNKGVSYGDLLAEGNLGLVEGIIKYIDVLSNEKHDIDLEFFVESIKQNIIKSLNKVVSEQNGSMRVGNHIADRANTLDSASVELCKDLGRTPTLEELAKYLSLPEDEVERIMKISLDALTVDGAENEEQK